MTVDRRWRITLRVVGLGYLAALLLIPIGLIFYRTFEDGFGAFWDAITTPAAISAFSLTLMVTAIAVPLNTVFGIFCALALARGRFKGKWFLNAIIDLPFAISPVVVGLSLILVYGRGGWLGDLPFQVIFSVPASCSPRSSSRCRSWSARSRRCCWRSATSRSRPPRRSARRAGRPSGASRSRRSGGAWPTASCSPSPAASASSVRSRSFPGRSPGETETLTLLVEKRFQNFDLAGAYAASALLAIIALGTLFAMTAINPRKDDA